MGSIDGKIGKWGKVSFAFFFGLLFIFSLQSPAKADVMHLKQGDSLKEAVQKAKKGDAIFLEKGMYEGPVVIDKPLAVKGEKGTVIKGNGKGNVITVMADGVSLSGLTIQGSGKRDGDCGIFLDKTKRNVIQNNKLKDVQFGIYIKNGRNNKIIHNDISSFNVHFSKRGNGIHVFKGKDQRIEKNRIHQVRDGIYFDYANGAAAKENTVTDSRYGMHLMFSRGICAENNTVKGNITGLMVMDSGDLQFLKNNISRQLHFRGTGVFFYETSHVLLEENEIVENTIGLSFERASHTETRKNVIAANQVGLQFLKGNKDNIFSENNFISNIVSSTIGNEKIRLDNGKKGNYWDDYKSYDLNGDGIGELPYKAGSLYDHLLKRQPFWQFFFESPSVLLWSKAESLFPTFGAVEVYDEMPLPRPVDLSFSNKQKKDASQASVGLLGAAFIFLSLFIIAKGRNYR